MDDQWIYPSESQADAAAQLDALQRAQDELWVELRNEDDPERRMALLSEFGHNRSAIEALTRQLAGAEPSRPDDAMSYRVELIDEEIDGPDMAERRDGVAAYDSTNLEDAGLDEGDLDDAAHDDVDLDHQVLDDAVLDDAALHDASGDDVAPDRVADGGHGDPAGAVKPLSFDDSGELVELDDHDAAAFLRPDEPVHLSTPGSVASHLEGPGQLADTIFGQPRSGPSFAARGAGAAGQRGAYSNDRGGREGLESIDHPSGPRGAYSDDRSGREGPDSADHPISDVPPPRHRGPAPAGRTHPDGGVDDQYGIGRSHESGPGRARPRVTSSGRARGPAGGPAATSQYPAVRAPRPVRPAPEAPTRSPRRALVLLGGLAVVLGAAWLLLGRGQGEAPTSVASEVADNADGDSPAGPGADAGIDEILAMLQSNGLDTVGAERRGEVIFLTGSVPTPAERDFAIGLAQGVVPDPVDGSELVTVQQGASTQPDAAATPRAAAFQSELRRVVAATPIIFGVGETAITDLHARILNSVASIIAAYPELQVTIVGFTDNTGSASSNRQISLARAEGVKAYLVDQGIPEANLIIDARGEDVASGSEAIANLERRVEFEVSGAEGAAVAGSSAAPIRIAIVAPSARNDLAFTQSMVDAVNVVAAERGNVEVAITDNTFVPEDAAAAIRDYAAQGYDLVVAHGSQFGSALLEIAPEFPDVAFAWGTASDTFGLANVYAYDAAAGQGGYVMGSMATLLSQTGVVGIVGPIEVGDAQLYVEGFQAGALSSKADATVLVSYTGSFSDLTLAAEVARSHVGSGADVMTGSAQMVVGAVSVASESNALWFGTQANQTSLAPSLVVASQVYHWEVILRQIVNDIDAGTQGGRTYTADLANGGLVIEYNPDYPLPDAVRQRADEVAAGIVNGAIIVPTG